MLLRAVDPDAAGVDIPLASHPAAARLAGSFALSRSRSSSWPSSPRSASPGPRWSRWSPSQPPSPSLDRYRQLGHAFDGRRLALREGSLRRRWSGSIPMPRSPSSCEARRARGAPDSPRSASTSARAQGHAGRSTSARSRPPSSFVACGRSSSSRSCPTRWRGFPPTRSAAQRRRGRATAGCGLRLRRRSSSDPGSERDAPGVHEAGEGPGREEQPGGDGVRLEEEGRARHQVGVGVEGEDAAEPGAHGLAVVVLAEEEVVAEGRRHAGEERDEQEGYMTRSLLGVAVRTRPTATRRAARMRMPMVAAAPASPPAVTEMTW